MWDYFFDDLEESDFDSEASEDQEHLPGEKRRKRRPRMPFPPYQYFPFAPPFWYPPPMYMDPKLMGHYPSHYPNQNNTTDSGLFSPLQKETPHKNFHDPGSYFNPYQ